MRRLTILGATGSIGASTLDIVRQYPSRYRVYALTAHTQIERLLVLCLEFRPDLVVVANPQDAARVSDYLRAHNLPTMVGYGPDDLIQASIAAEVHTVVAAIVGAAGLPPTLAAAKAGKRILLANKEALVMSGDLLMQAVKQSGAELLPIDSEHNAIFQCLPTQTPYYTNSIEKITLTASGGPFRLLPIEQLENVTPDQACAHPNWRMGRKISVDCATMLNKGLEVIEAYWLFAVPVSRLNVMVHPQSIVHSMVSYVDGSVLAQMGHPDMRIPIAHALAYPERLATNSPHLDLSQYGQLEFEAPDFERFPCLQLAFDVLRVGGGASVLLNAANEVAVAAFLAGQIRFTAIAQIVSQILHDIPSEVPSTLEAVLALDRQVRTDANRLLKNYQFA